MRMFNLTTLPARNDGLVDLFRDVERVFEDFGRGWQPQAQQAKDSGWIAPRINVVESKDALEVSAELPGVAEKDIDVQLDGKVLTIKAQRVTEEAKGDKTWHVVERSSGSFSRSMTLPFEAKADEVEATFSDGVLSLRLPKPAAAKVEVKKISVNAAPKDTVKH